MAVKSVVTISINDTDFQRYAAAFAKYNAALQAQPGIWNNVNQAAGATAASAQQIGAAVGAAQFALNRNLIVTTTIGNNAAQTAGFWSSIAQSAGKFTSRVVEATRSLLRWGELTGLISGILGAGGLFGIDRLATSAGEQRKHALGLGVTPGEAKAFDVDYGRVVDTGAFLSNVNEMLHDVTKRVGLYGAGMGERELKGKDTAEVGSELLMHLKKIADQTPDELMGNVLDKQLKNVVSLQEFQRIKNTPAGELEEYRQSYQRDTGKLEFTPSQTKIWQDLQTQFDRVSSTLSHDFIVRLTDLAPALGRMSESFLHVADVVLNNPHMEKWINEVAGAMDRFSKYLTEGDVDKDIDYLMGKLDTLFTDIGRVVKEIPEIVDAFSNAVKAIKNFFADPLGTIKEGGVNGPFENPLNDPGSDEFNKKRDMGLHPERYDEQGNLKDQPAAAEEKPSWDWTGWRDWWPGNWHMMRATPAPTPEQKTRFDQLEESHGLPHGLLNSVMQTESHGDPNATSPMGAKGQFQFMDKTAAAYGVQNPRDFMQASGGAARLLQHLLSDKMFKGDLTEAVAGYNMDPQHLKEIIAAYHEKWSSHLPPETQHYVPQVLAGQQANPQPKFVPPAATRSPVVVKLYPEPGANPYISTSQLAY